MTEVVSVRFRNRGKSYFFAPNGRTVKSGDKLIVETSNGLELAECRRANHMVEDDQVVQPLRPVIRLATRDDLRVAEINSHREKEAFDICNKKIAEHGLDMKLVTVECSFEGSKTTFFFTSEGRVDFRELVKDLAGIFRNRIELRQIGVRDEAKMLGGLGICGRPFCCSKFLDDFQPVSTKMAKVQSMSLNPSKISGSCGRLMCCLRYEQEAYEELLKNVPKLGAFVETPTGYGVVTQVNLLRQLVKVKLDGEGDDTVRSFRAVEVAAVPGGRPRDGEPLPSVLKYIPEPEEAEPEIEWKLPKLFAEDEPEPNKSEANKPSRSRHGKPKRGKGAKAQTREGGEAKAEKAEKAADKPQQRQDKPQAKTGSRPSKQKPKPRPHKPKTEETAPQTEAKPTKPQGEGKKKSNDHRRRYYSHKKPKKSPGGEG